MKFKLTIVSIILFQTLLAFPQKYYVNKIPHKSIKSWMVEDKNSCGNEVVSKYKYKFIKEDNILAISEKFNLHKANQEIAQKLLTTLNFCGNKIWPGYNLHTLNIVLIDNNIENQITLSPKENSIFTFPKNQIPVDALRFMYYFFEVGDQRWMSINPMSFKDWFPNATYDFVVSKSLGLALHEGFHHTTQASWSSADHGSESQRGTIVPIAWEPRFYRSMIYQNLVTVYKSNFFNHTALRKAKYWYDLWSKNYPLEVLMSTDDNEGSAAYVELLGEAYAAHGCEDFNPKVKNYILKDLSEGKYPFIDGKMFALDNEGYLVGKLAALILEQHKVIPDWKERLSRGQDQLAQLMSLVTPKLHIIDDAKKKVFIETQQKEQAQVDEYLSPTYKNLKDPNALFVSLPSSWAPDVFSPLAFYYDPQMKVSFMPLAVAMNFKDEKSNSSVLAKVKVVGVEMDAQPPCVHEKDGQWIFMVSEKEFTVTADRIQINNSFLEGNAFGSITIDSQGRKWFCGNIKK